MEKLQNFSDFNQNNIPLQPEPLTESMVVYTKTDRSRAYFADSKLYTVFKGDEIYNVEIKKGYPMRWKYNGRGEPNKHIIGNGKIVRGIDTNKELFIILNNTLKKSTD